MTTFSFECGGGSEKSSNDWVMTKDVQDRLSRLRAAAVIAQSKNWIDPLEAALTRNLSPTTTQATLTKQVESLKRAYNEERTKLAELISDRRLAEGKVVAARERRPRKADEGVPSGPRD